MIGDLFALDTRRVESDALWHADCELFEVSSEGRVLGHVVLDLFSREGKFGHQMVVPLRPHGHDGGPVCAVLGNMGDAQRLLRFGEVETMLHELGHVFHCLCGAPARSIASWTWPMVPWCANPIPRAHTDPRVQLEL